jgi:HlyD family secretion protein
MSISKPKRSMTRRIVTIVILLALVAGGAWYQRQAMLAAPALPSEVVAQEVQRGDLVVTITEGGQLNAIQSVTVVSMVQGQPRIISIVAEGSQAKKGDLLVELDSSELQERLNQQEVNYQNALASYNKSVSDREIKKSQNESGIREAELNVEFAEIDLRKYRDGEWPQTFKKCESDITIAEAELRRAQDRLSWTDKLFEKGYATRAELEADRLTVKRGELEFEQAKDKLRLTELYDHPLKVKRLEANLAKVRDELDRVKRRAESELEQADTDVTNKQATLELQTQKRDDLKVQVANTRILAPADGMVVYASSTQGGRWGSQNRIEEGATIRERQEIIKLPDVSAMKVEVKIHESRMNQLRLGQAAYVTLDALPGVRLKGRVDKIAILPDPSSNWMNPNLKVYNTDIVIEDTLPSNLKPGLSARCEIVVARLENVLTVPIQAVTTVNGQQMVHLATSPEPTAVPVEVGLYNESLIEIVSGLEQGQSIMLNPPPPSQALTMATTVVAAGELKPMTTAELTALREPAPAPAEAAAGEGAKLPEAMLSRLPADRRQDLVARWEKMSEAERKAMLEKMASRASGGGDGRKNGASPGASPTPAAPN